MSYCIKMDTLLFKKEKSMSQYKENYEILSDERLLKLSGSGDIAATEFLLARYKNTVRSKARMYFLVGADHDDIVQEGMIGLFKAIRDFDSSKQASFKSFAELCVRRQIITAIKAATRKKHIPLNSYISLSKPLFDDENGDFADFLSELEATGPEDMFIWKENAADIVKKIEETLSKLEKEVLNMYLDGKSYQEIAKLMNRPPKSIDNALQRIKKKLEKQSY